jgi:sulfotransferase
MPQKIFFQSSLPRSGSTLFQNIIGQNPDFYVTPTSGVLELLYAARNNFTNSPEFKAQNSQEMRKGFAGFCKAGLEGYFDSITDKPYVIDKSRGWGVHYNWLNEFYPQPKIVCLVRDLRGIFASMEKNFRKNQHLDSGIVNHATMAGTTTEKRIDVWARSQPVGLSIERLQQIINEGNDKHILFIKFEDLCDAPQIQLNRAYDFFELPRYQHDPNNVQQLTKEDDSVYGIYGDHKVKPKIQPLPKDYKDVLGVHACNWIKNNYAWFYDYFKYF